MAFSCDLNTLIQSAKCLSDLCVAESDRGAIDIYTRIANLAAIGGTDYRNNLKQLMIDSANWQRRSKDTLAAVSLWIDILNANADGAGLGTDPKAILALAKCLKGECLGKEQMRGILVFLKCAINTLGKPD